MSDEFDDDVSPDDGAEVDEGEERDEQGGDDEGHSEEELHRAAKEATGEEEDEEERRPDQTRQHLDNLNRALRQERTQRKALARQIQQREQAEAQRAGRLEKLLTVMAREQGVDPKELQSLLDPDAAPKVPDPNEDGIGHIVAKFGEMLTPLQQQVQALLIAQGEQMVQAEAEAVDSFTEADIANVVQQAPDYDHAEAFLIDHLYRSASAQMAQQHPEWDEDDVHEYVSAGLYRTANDLRRRYAAEGKSLATAIYQRALAVGYQPQAAPAPGERRKAPGGSKTAALKQSLQRSVGAGAGKPASPRKASVLTRVLDPAAMSDEEFDKLTSNPKEWKRLAAEVAGL